MNKRQRIERSRKAGLARAKKLTRERRIEIAIMGANQKHLNWRNGPGNAHQRRVAKRRAELNGERK